MGPMRDAGGRQTPRVLHRRVEVHAVIFNRKIVETDADLHRMTEVITVGLLGRRPPSRTPREHPINRMADLRGADDGAIDVAALLVGLVELHRAATQIVT